MWVCISRRRAKQLFREGKEFYICSREIGLDNAVYSPMLVSCDNRTFEDAIEIYHRCIPDDVSTMSDRFYIKRNSE